MEARLLVSSGLFAEPRFRRLFKARHEEMRAMEIRTKTLAVAPIADPQQRFTVYKVQIRSSLRRADAGEWTLAKRYSEFARFREALLKRVRTWEQALGADARLDKQFMLISNALRKPLAPTFPRKHMRRDTDVIVRERRAGLQGFLRKLLDAYADLSVYVNSSNSSNNNNSGGAVGVSAAPVPTSASATANVKNARAHALLHEMFLELEAFLDIPAVQKEVERAQVAAILSLQDVDDADADDGRDGCGRADSSGDGATKSGRERRPEDDNGGDSDHNDVHDTTSVGGPVCCICLMGPDESAAPPTVGVPVAPNKMVRLPCAHKFHEDCVIGWFNASTTCPLCRCSSIALGSPTDSESSV